jgi:hypothetical protein
MTDDRIEAKALALVNEIEREKGEKELTPRIIRRLIIDEALCRAIEQYEAFKQEVSDAVEAYKADNPFTYNAFLLERFIIPKPKPDPLAGVLEEVFSVSAVSGRINAALEARGLEIKEIPPPEGDGGQQRIAGGEAKDNTKQGQSK